MTSWRLFASEPTLGTSQSAAAFGLVEVGSHHTQRLVPHVRLYVDNGVPVRPTVLLAHLRNDVGGVVSVLQLHLLGFRGRRSLVVAL